MTKKDWGPIADWVAPRRIACLDAIRTVSVLADAWEETHDEPEALRAAVVTLATEMGLACREPDGFEDIEAEYERAGGRGPARLPELPCGCQGSCICYTRE